MSRQDSEGIREATELLNTVQSCYSKHTEPDSGVYDCDHPKGGYIHEEFPGRSGGPIWGDLARDKKEWLLGKAFERLMVRNIEPEDSSRLIKGFSRRGG
jgi:hypothetical protein